MQWQESAGGASSRTLAAAPFFLGAGASSKSEASSDMTKLSISSLSDMFTRGRRVLVDFKQEVNNRHRAAR